MKASECVREFIDEYVFWPCDYWPHYRVKERCFRRTAAEEIYHQIQRDESHPIDICKQFMDWCKNGLTDNDRVKNEIFNAAYDVAFDIMLEFESGGFVYDTS